jgi:triosephosphate isomerase
MASITPLIAGNWKMNGLGAALGEVERLGALLAAGAAPGCTIVICPPATLLSRLTEQGAVAGIRAGRIPAT